MRRVAAGVPRRFAYIPEAEHADIPSPAGSARRAAAAWAGGLRRRRARRPRRRDPVPVPPRPALPVLLGTALGMWACAAAVFTLAEGWDVARCAAAGVAGTVVAGVAAAAMWRRPARAATVAVLLGCALGVACAAAGAAQLHATAARAVGLSGEQRFEAVADGTEGAYGPSCLARVALPGGAGSAVVRVRLPEGSVCPRYGEVFTARASFSAPGGSSAAYLWQQGAVAEARASEAAPVQRHDALGALVDVRNRAIEALMQGGVPDGGLTAALVCGWRGGLDEGLYRAFQATGLAHLVAVSGSHLSIVAACAAAVLRALRVPRAAAALVQAALVVSYLVLTAVPVSAVRSAAMALAGLVAFTAQRRPAALSALSACIVAFFALDPKAAVSASLALSALSTLGIVAFGGLAAAWIGRLAPALPGFAAEALALTGASSLLATPLSVALFAQLPLVSPLANLVAAPLFAPVCTVGLVAALGAVAAPPLAGVLGQVACAGGAAMAAAVEALACIPYASIPATVPAPAALAASAAGAAAVWLKWPEPRLRPACIGALACAAACAVAVVFAPQAAGTEIVMLDVGQGDALLVRSRGAAVLVDTGNQDAKLREALARCGVSRLDAVLVTHGDDDHMGSLSSLAGTVQVGRVLVARDALACPCDSCARLVSEAHALVGEGGVEGLSAGDALAVGAFTLEVVWPAAFSDEGGNADSVCLLAAADVDGDGAGDWRALLVGDAERDQLRALVDSGAVGAVDVYKVGHHGSKNALDDETAQALSPSVALVSAGQGNRYGHPAPSTLAQVEAAGAQVFRTDVQGDVSCRFEADRIAVGTQR